MLPRMFIALTVASLVLYSCNTEKASENTVEQTAQTSAEGGQSAVSDNVSQMDVVKIAASSKDHTTLVKALQAADLVNALSNAGPFTVFAPTNAAFDQLPAGTLEELTKPENKEKLANILYHHVQVSVYSKDRLSSMSSIMMFDGKQEAIEKKGDDIYIGGAKILGAARASNGIVYIIDKVLLPK